MTALDERRPTACAPEDRGRTTVPAKVVARIAEQCAFEVASVGSNAGGVLGIGARRDFATRPRAEAEIYGSIVVLRLNVGIAFPTTLRDALKELREHVAARVEQLSGLEVGRIDVQISWLNSTATGRRILR